MSKRTLSALRIDEKTLENMKSALRKYNSESLVELSEASFRRLAIELLSQMILRGMDVPVKLTK